MVSIIQNSQNSSIHGIYSIIFNIIMSKPLFTTTRRLFLLLYFTLSLFTLYYVFCAHLCYFHAYLFYSLLWCYFAILAFCCYLSTIWPVLHALFISLLCPKFLWQNHFLLLVFRNFEAFLKIRHYVVEIPIGLSKVPSFLCRNFGSHFGDKKNK